MLRNLSAAYWKQSTVNLVCFISMCHFLKEDRTETQEKKLSWQAEKEDKNQR
jgi:hypothetical protein